MPLHGRRREADREAVRDGARVDRPIQVYQAIRQRRREFPTVRGLFRRVRRGHDAHAGRQREIADDAFQHDPQHRRLHGGRRGGQLVEEQHALTRLGKAARPRRRRQPHAAVHDDG
jgi:hypothetical protein